jgi:hypothetical protein
MLRLFSDTPQGRNSSKLRQCLDNHNKDNTLQEIFETEIKVTWAENSIQFRGVHFVDESYIYYEGQKTFHFDPLDFEDKFWEWNLFNFLLSEINRNCFHSRLLTLWYVVENIWLRDVFIPCMYCCLPPSQSLSLCSLIIHLTILKFTIVRVAKKRTIIFIFIWIHNRDISV